MADYIQSGDPAGQNDLEAEDEAINAPLEFIVPHQPVATRLDKVLAQLLPDYSRSRLQQWIENQQVMLDGKPATTRSPVLGGERIEVTVAALPEALAFQPEAIALDVVHEDADILVINKPAGLVVHPAAGNWSGTLLNGLLSRDPALTHVPRAGIVHRLDKDTSGLMVVARTLQVQTDLVRQLQARTVKREYLALVWGQMKNAGAVEAPIARDPRNPLRMAVVPGGKAALTHYTPLAWGALVHQKRELPLTLVQCRLATGRTHQIRVHLQHIGFSLLGDPVYGKKSMPEVFGRQALHAWQLGLIHPRSGQACQWQQPLPADMQQLLKEVGIEWN